MLPAKPTTEKYYGAEQDIYKDVHAGSYWEYRGEDELDSEPLLDCHIFLLKEVRYVDGEIHTVILGYPPYSKYSSTTLLIDDFMTKHAFRPDGKEQRAAEMALIQERLQGIQHRISQGPQETEVLALVNLKNEEEEATTETGAQEATNSEGSSSTDLVARGQGMIPKELLPSQDVIAAQKQVQLQIAKAEAVSKWVYEQTNLLKEEMKLLNAFNLETAQALQSSISKEIQKGEKLLKNVETMKLFLGEELEVDHLVEGESCSEEEPLTFLQQLLYLDEEIFIEGELVDGFTHKELPSLKETFAAYPNLVERMLPYKRSVVLARVRRNTHPDNLFHNGSFVEVMEANQRAQLDKEIYIFIRDGGNLYMVKGSQTTGATRLFPSAQEINAIFTSGYGDNKRQISPDSIEYSYRREQHDDVALHYKRFLITFWGLHERLGLFGPFLRKGTNWLSETVHNDAFRFIHDEENVLSNGRPSIHEYLQDNQRFVQSGSRVLCLWNDLINERTAPGMYSRDGEYKKYHPVNASDLNTVSRKKDDLVVRCLGIKRSYFSSDKSEEKGFSVKLFTELGYTTFKTSTGDRVYTKGMYEAHESGFLDVDATSIEDLDYYINSRINRREYGIYLQAFVHAKKILEEEQEAMSKVAQFISEKAGVDNNIASAAILIWRRQNKFSTPVSAPHMTAIAKIARAKVLSNEALEAQGFDRGFLRYTDPKGQIHVYKAEEWNFGFPVKGITSHTILSVDAKGKLKLISKDFELFKRPNVGRAAIDFLMDDVMRDMEIYGADTNLKNLNIEDLELANNIDSDGMDVSELINRMLVAPSTDRIAELMERVYNASSNLVYNGPIAIGLGVIATAFNPNKGSAVCFDSDASERNYHILALSIDPCKFSRHSGHLEFGRLVYSGFYKNNEAGRKLFDERAEKEGTAVELHAIPMGHSESLSEVVDPLYTVTPECPDGFAVYGKGGYALNDVSEKGLLQAFADALNVPRSEYAYMTSKTQETPQEVLDARDAFIKEHTHIMVNQKSLKTALEAVERWALPEGK